MVADEQDVTFETKCRPISVITTGAQAVHGIAWKDVQSSPLLPQVLLQFVEWLTQQCEASPEGSSTLVLMGHNICQFDLPILSQWAAALNVEVLDALLKSASLEELEHIEHRWISEDTLIMAQELQQRRRLFAYNCRLQTLTRYFNIKHEVAHRALNDVRANVQLYHKLKEL